MSELQEVKKPNGTPPPISEESKPKNLVMKLCEVMAAIGRIEKRGENKFHNYKYATEADLVEVIRGELASRHLFIFPSVISTNRTVLQRQTRDGLKETGLTDIMVRWTFCDGDSGEIRECDIPGCGEDSGDKGIYKALTGSEKYLLMKAFLIPTGDDPEKDEKGSSEAARAIGEQKKKDFEAAKRAREQSKSGDLTQVLKESVEAANSNPKDFVDAGREIFQAGKEYQKNRTGKPDINSMLEAAKNEGLFEVISGTIQTVRNMATSAAKGSRPYRKIVITTVTGGGLVDLEISAFDNFKLSDGTCFEALDHPETEGGTARLIVERNGKYLNLKDIKQLGEREWDARLGVIKR